TQNAKPFIHPAKGNFAFKTVLCHLKRVLCFLMTNTAHYMSRHSKHLLNTDVLNGKHYYEMGKHQYEGLIRNIMLLYAQDNIDNVVSEIDLHSFVNVVAFCVSGLGICV